MDNSSKPKVEGRTEVIIGCLLFLTDTDDGTGGENNFTIDGSRHSFTRRSELLFN